MGKTILDMALFKKKEDALADSSVTMQIDKTAAQYVAMLLLEDGYLLPNKFQVYKLMMVKIFGHRINENAELRATLLDFILHQSTDETVFPKLMQAIATEQPTNRMKTAIVDHILLALEENLRPYSNRVTELDQLIQIFGLPRADYSHRIDTILAQGGIGAVLPEPDGNTEWYKPLSLGAFKRENSKRSGNDLKYTLDFQTSRSKENDSIRKLIHDLHELNHIVGSELLNTELKALGTQVQDQAHRIAIVGEIKHGKSSIFNRLTGRTISPVGEGTATTGAVVELFYTEEPTYEAKWINQEGLEGVLRYIDNNKHNPHVLAYGYELDHLMDKSYFKTCETYDQINSIEELNQYICVEGQFAPGVELVRIGNPVDCLKHGAVLVDTPGLNDPMQVRDKITKQQAVLADTIVFVMRADKFGTESERQFLADLLSTSRASALMVVLTHMDRRGDNEDYAKLLDNVREWLIKVSPNPLLYSAPIFAFNAAANLEALDREYAPGTGFGAFVDRLSKPVDESEQNKRYVTWLQEMKSKICELALMEVERYVGVESANGQSEMMIQQMSALIAQLEEANSAYSGQLDARVALLKAKMMDDYEAIRFEAKQCKRLIEENLRAAVEAKVRELGDKYASKDKWSVFNRDTATGIIRMHANEMQYKSQAILNGWDQMLTKFDEEIQSDFQANANRLMDIKSSYDHLSAKDNMMIYSLCQANEIFSALGKTIQKAQYIGGGYLLATGISVATIKTLVGTAVGISFPPAIPWVVAGLTLAGIGSKLSGVLDKDKQRYYFIQSKEKDLQLTVDKLFETYDQTIEEEFEKLFQRTINTIEHLYSPVIETAHASTNDLKYQIEIGRRMKSDLLFFTKQIVGE